MLEMLRLFESREGEYERRLATMDDRAKEAERERLEKLTRDTDFWGDSWNRDVTRWGKRQPDYRQAFEKQMRGYPEKIPDTVSFVLP